MPSNFIPYPSVSPIQFWTSTSWYAQVHAHTASSKSKKTLKQIEGENGEIKGCCHLTQKAEWKMCPQLGPKNGNKSSNHTAAAGESVCGAWVCYSVDPLRISSHLIACSDKVSSLPRLGFGAAPVGCLLDSLARLLSSFSGSLFMRAAYACVTVCSRTLYGKLTRRRAVTWVHAHGKSSQLIYK